jgi:hypothetical protein
VNNGEGDGRRKEGVGFILIVRMSVLLLFHITSVSLLENNILGFWRNRK